jgi:hypothetical protein
MATKKFGLFTPMESIRQSSIAVTTALGYPVNPHLPLLDVSAVVRSISEIVGRIFAMHGVAAAAYGFDRRGALSWLRRESCDEFLTPTEMDFLESGLGDRQVFTDQVEGLFALTWAVNIVRSLDFSLPCPNEFVFHLPNLKAEQDGEDFRIKARLRPPEEIVTATDLAYCLHWAIRDAQLRGTKIPDKVEPYVIVERRRALEWLLADECWDDVSLDT